MAAGLPMFSWCIDLEIRLSFRSMPSLNGPTDVSGQVTLGRRAALGRTAAS